MKILLGFLVISFFIGYFLGEVKPIKRVGLILLMCLALSFAYYFLNQI